jgi:hypothetical protein
MKNTIFILALFFSSCEKEPQTFCWIFTTVQTTTVTPSTPGYPQKVNSTTEQCGITEDEAKDVCNKIKSTTQSSTGGVTVKITTTCTYKKK